VVLFQSNRIDFFSLQNLFCQKKFYSLVHESFNTVLIDMGLVIDFLERGGAMMLAGVFILLIVAAKTLRPSKRKAKKSNAGSKGEVIAGRREQRVIVVYSRSNLSPSDWKDFGLTIIDLKENERGSKVGEEVHEPNEKKDEDGADAPLVERLEMSVESGPGEDDELTPEDEEQLQDLIEFVEEHHRLDMNQDEGEEPLDISGLGRDQGM